ncbi:hypothetical protein CHU98_g5559 [Xylaria longipes]|nr:hypothetical protein CHU98_g5559 [Xylaria longipes]
MAYIYKAMFRLCLAISSREPSTYRNYNTRTCRSPRPRVFTTDTNSYRTYSLPPSQRPLTTAEQSYIEITYYSVTTMKLSALVLIASARSFIATAMPRNETSTIVAANSSSLVLLNATSQTMSDANQSLQPDVENMDEEKCLGGEEGCVVEYGKRRFRRPDPCTAYLWYLGMVSFLTGKTEQDTESIMVSSST